MYETKCFDMMIDHCDEVIHTMNCLILNKPYKTELLKEIYKKPILEDAYSEVEKNIMFYQEKEGFLKSYIDKVYFHGYGRKMAMFNSVRDRLWKKYDDDLNIMMADDTISRFMNGYYESLNRNLGNLRILIKKVTGRVVPSSFVMEDFTITGEYIVIDVPKKKQIESELSMKQVALIHYYKGHQITRDNGDAIALKYGWNSDKSGEALYHKYNFWSSKQNRVGLEGTKLKNENKINLLKSVIGLLPNNSKNEAQKELALLKDAFDSQDW